MKDLHQNQYITANFLDAQAFNDNAKNRHKKDKIKKNSPWYKIEKGEFFMFEKEHPTLTTGEAYRRLARKEYQKGNKELATRYMKRARENGCLMRFEELFSKPLQEHVSHRKSAVKGLKMPSTRLIRAIMNPDKKSEEKPMNNWEKIRKLGLENSAILFKQNGKNDYRFCYQYSTDDEKHSVDGSYIFASESVNCPNKKDFNMCIVNAVSNHLTRKNFERMYVIDRNGTITWYEPHELAIRLQKEKERIENYMNSKAA